MSDPMTAAIIGTAMQAGSQGQTNLGNMLMTAIGWGRENTAVRRRVADLEAAGLNPVLAAGSAASSQAPIPLQDPLHGQNVGNSMVGAMQAKQNLAQSQAQVDLINANASIARAEARKKAIEADTFALEHGRDPSTGESIAVDYGLQALRSEQEAKNVAMTTERDRQLFIGMHKEELFRLELQARKEGLSENEIKNRVQRAVAELTEKEARWFAVRQISGVVGQSVGTAARLGRIPY